MNNFSIDLNNIDEYGNPKKKKRRRNVNVNVNYYVYNNWNCRIAGMPEPTISNDMKRKKNKFEESSELERTKMTAFFNKVGIEHFGFTSVHEFVRHDGWFYKNGKKYMFEVKVRNIASDAYQTSVIEYGKYNYLKFNSKMDDFSGAFLFVFYTDGKILIQDIDRVEEVFSKMKAPKTTSGDRTMVEKQFLEIPINVNNLHDE